MHCSRGGAETANLSGDAVLSPPNRTEERLGWGSHFMFSIQWVSLSHQYVPCGIRSIC